jgi:hypothetical protein
VQTQEPAIPFQIQPFQSWCCADSAIVEIETVDIYDDARFYGGRVRDCSGSHKKRAII